MSSSFSSSSLQSSASWLPPWPFSLLPSLLFKLHAQPNTTSLFLLVGLGATTPPHTSAVCLATAFQGFWCYFVKYQSGQGKT